MSHDVDAPELRVEGPSEGEFRWVVTIEGPRRAGQLEGLLDDAARLIDGGRAQLWIQASGPGDDWIAAAYGFHPYRDLWQLRCELPTSPSSVSTRAFTPADLDELVEVNNRAFHWHPEQGGRTSADLSETIAAPWFDPDGLRLHHRGDRLAGFCWTKIHADEIPPVGEIFVIAIDPDFHGQGLGVPMTEAGLDWLADRGLRHGMLYVESDNHSANATYRRIGFRWHQTNRAYERDADGSPR